MPGKAFAPSTPSGAEINPAALLPRNARRLKFLSRPDILQILRCCAHEPVARRGSARRRSIRPIASMKGAPSRDGRTDDRCVKDADM
jgi:hypothetical protein